MKHLKYFKESINFKEHNIDIIIDSYLESALWTNEENEEFDFKTIYSFSTDTLLQIRKEIEWLVNIAGDSLDNMSDTAIGHDIWLTRNHHGAGFGDRLIEDYDIEILEELSNQLGTADAYVGDDGKVYITSSKEYQKFDAEKWKEEMKLKKATDKYNI